LFGEYTYDNNGNMISDLNKKINSITYNYLNLPVKIAFPTKAADSRIENAYTAAGIKIKETVYTAGILTHTTDYSGAFVYKDNWLAYILTPEGRIVIPQPTGNPSGKTLTAASYYYEYQLKDHLGNVRVTFTDKDKNGIPEVQSENHYYPFGMPIGALSYTNNVSTLNSIDYKNEYFYNGKEAEDDFGLGWLDYGARMYDPVVGRWWSVDPLAEKSRRLSPYTYCLNNPMRFVDLDGMLEYPYEINLSMAKRLKKFTEELRDEACRAEQRGEKSYETGPPDNYTVDENGHITLECTDESDPEDHLYVKNEDGSINRNKSIVVQKGVLDNINNASATVLGDNGKPKKENYNYFKGPDLLSDSYRLFKFLAINTKVEFGLTQLGTGSNYISTGHLKGEEPGCVALVVLFSQHGVIINQNTHDHPMRSIFGISDLRGDQGFAAWAKQYSPGTGMYMYDVTTGITINYTQH
jgi:RHS repeat-associated protein